MRMAFNFEGGDGNLLVRQTDFARRELGLKNADSVRDRMGPMTVELATSLLEAERSPCGTGHTALLMPRGRPRIFGRESLIDAIASQLESAESGSTYVIHGMPGVGKSELAIAVARALADRFSGSVWIDGRNQIEEDLLFGLALLTSKRVNYYAGRSPTQRAAAVGKELGDRRILVVLDDVSSDNLIKLSQRTAQGAVILATSHFASIALHDRFRFNPGALDAASAALLLQDSADGSVTIDKSDPDFHRINEKIGGNALALTLLGKRLERLGSLSSLADRFEAVGTMLLEARVGTKQLAFSTAIDTASEDLDSHDLRTFQLLGSHLAGVGDVQLLTATGRSLPEHVRDSLQSLHDAALVDRLKGERWSLHPLISDHVIRRFPAARPRLRLLKAYQVLAEEAEAALRGPAEEPWLRRLDQEALAIQRQLEWAVTSGFHNQALSVAGYLGWYWTVRGLEEHGRHIYQQLEISQERRRPTLSVLGRAHYGAAYLATNQAQYEDAVQHFQKAVNAFAASSDDDERLRAAAALGYALWGLGEFDEARDIANQVVQDPHATDYHVAAAENVLGLVFSHTTPPQYERSRKHLLVALKLRLRIGDEWGALSTEGNLLAVERAQGESTTGLRRRLARNQKQRVKLNDPFAIANGLSSIAELDLSDGFIEAAFEGYSTSLQIHLDLDNPLGSATSLTGLATLALEVEGLDLAEQLFGIAKRLLAETVRVPLGPAHRAQYDSLSATLPIVEVEGSRARIEELVHELETAIEEQTA